MANTFFKVKKGLKIEPVTGSTVSQEGDIAYNDTSNQLELYGASAAESITTDTNTQTLTNKTLTSPVITTPTLTVNDSGFTVQDNSDTSKKLQFQVSGVTTSTTRTLTVPDADTTIVGTDATQTLTNKTLTAPVISTISNTGTLTLPTSTDTLVGRDTTDTLTNKTLTAPVISTISNTGTLTLPTSTDTLVGKATTDTFTNKTFDADGTGNSITNIENADIKAGAAIAVNKLAAVTASKALASDASGFITATSVTDTELGYVSGVTSAIQTQINAKAPSASPTFSGTITTPLTASRAMVTGASSELAVSSVTSTELGYVSGVTSAIQTQLNTISASTQTSSIDIKNLGLACSVGSSALTIALKQSDGSTDPSTGSSAVAVGMRSSTATSGAYNTRSVTSALSLVVSSGSTLGHLDGKGQYIYVYLIDNSGTLELACSSKRFDDNSLVSTTAEGGAGAADSDTVMYSTTARSDVPCRLIARLLSSQTTAGTWAAVPTEVCISSGILAEPKVVVAYSGTATGSLSGSPSLVTFPTKVIDDDGIYSSGTTTITKPGDYDIDANIFMSSSSSSWAGTIYIYVNGSAINGVTLRPQTASSYAWTISATARLRATDTVAIYADNGGATAALVSGATSHYMSIKRRS